MSNKPTCYKCKFSGDKFKIDTKTHTHCFNPELYPEKELEAGNISPWETLREWYNSCDKFEPKLIEPQPTTHL